MTDILGPASDAYAVTTRPGDVRTFGSSDTYFTDCTSSTAGDGTDVSAAFLNVLIANQRAVVRGNGTTKAGTLVVPNDNSDGMTLAALQHLGQRAVYARAVDTGVVNAIAVTFTPAPAELLDGMTFAVKAKATNTGPATIAVSGTAYPVVSKAGAALAGGEIVAGAWQDYRFDATRAAFQVGASAAGAAAPPQNALVHDGSATGGNTLTTTLVPAIASPLTSGLWMAVPITSANTGAATLDFGGGFGTADAVPVVSNKTGVALVGGEMPGGVGFLAWFYYDGSSARLMNPQATSFSKIVVATVNGTYTQTPGAKRVQGVAIGPGGPGGCSNGTMACCGAGGGAGEAVIFDIDLTVTPGPFVYTIGAAAAPSPASGSGTVAGSGSPTTFGATVVAYSGHAGLDSVGAGSGGLGGSGGVGLLSIPGNPGDGVVGNYFGSGEGMRGGNGGASILGGAGLGVDGDVSGTPIGSTPGKPGGNGLAFGAGGGGADSGSAGNPVQGGQGAQGVIIYREVF